MTTAPFERSGSTLRTNLHTHTTFSDGAFSLAEVVLAYEALGYDALAITDHNRWQDHGGAASGGLLILSSNEPSLSHGEHALATGVHAPSPVDHGEGPRERMQEIID